MREPLTITDVAPLIRSGELTPSELLEQCLARVDVYEPSVKAWAYLDRERARGDAARLTDELKRGQHRGPLHGIPVGIKDIIDVYDMPTGCGSKLWANSYARRDATCVERLRQAGAVILGKTVTTPFAYLDPAETRNPWNLNRTPGGSSSGSAAAVACGMALASLGTQTGGSTIRPASFCGVCALKPTHSVVSTEGVLPLAPSLDHIGVMANCVRDLAIVFQTIAGYDPAAEMTRARPVRDCVRNIDKELAAIPAESRRGEPKHRKRFLFTGEIMPDRLDPEMAKFMRKFEADLRSLAYSDAATSHIVLRPEFNEVHHRHYQVMAHESAMVHKERIRRHPEDYPPKIRSLVADGLLLSAEELSQAEYIRGELQGNLYSQPWPDPLVTPASLGPAPTSETTGDAWCNSPWSFLGIPAVSLPLGWSSEGMPLAVQFVGGEYMEDYLLARAAWVEKVFEMSKATKPRRLPPVP